MYNRDTLYFSAAQQVYRETVAIDKAPLPDQPVLSRPEHKAARDRVRLLLQQSENRLRHDAAELGLAYQTVSELNTGFGGPFASMFWKADSTEGDQFIIIAVKGTQSLDVREWLIDASCQKVPVAKQNYSFVADHDANAHEGFYHSLFPDRDQQEWNWLYQGIHANDAAQALVNAINAKAEEWKTARAANHKPPPKINIWVTGHSLGAAIASLLYARLLVISDLSDGIEVRDGYTYGTPMNTDAVFTDCYRDYMGTSKLVLPKQGNRGRYNWRIINNDDIVTQVPPNPNLIESAGVGEVRTVGIGYKGSLLDYCAIGHGIKYVNSGTLPLGLQGIRVICQNLRPQPELQNPSGLHGLWQKFVESRLNPIAPIQDHACKAYQNNLMKARQAMIDRASHNIAPK